MITKIIKLTGRYLLYGMYAVLIAYMYASMTYPTMYVLIERADFRSICV